ncbi:hypothetical protein Ocin01_13333 [Orchesella cincta]|uniref:Uncharacterized protein n=1 Tax=Orchesella cincta TaxID=48709 RepID=A0A1D2MK52_ORCCI|nr:hypothetical protein Ocin01_13333 [Orchesella cincta]
MVSTQSHVFSAVLLVFCQFSSCAFGLESLPHFGDFMEFHIGLLDACVNVTGGEASINSIAGAFAECTHQIVKDEKEQFGTLVAVCKNKEGYFQCWDNMKTETLTKCGKDKEQRLPTLYKNTVLSFCGSDNGAKKIEDMKKAADDTKPDDGDNCPDSAGIPWLENCQDMLPTFTSPDLCQRHAAIDQCVGKITCENIAIAKLIRAMYRDGRSLLQCNN